MAISEGSFPDVNVKESEKDEEYHKQATLSILRESLNNDYEFTSLAIQENYNFYEGIQSQEEMQFLQESEAGDTLPAIWMNYNNIKNKVDTLIGELVSVAYTLDVRGLNKEVVVEKFEERKRKFAKMMIKDDFAEMEERAQMPTRIQEELPETIGELDEYINKNYRTIHERAVKAILDYLVKYHQYKASEIAMYRDVLIANRCFCKTDIENDIPVVKRLDPRKMVFDTMASDDFLSDATYFGYIDYRPLSEVKMHYKLSDEEVDQIQHLGNQQPQYLGDTHYKNNYIGNSRYEYVRKSGASDELQVLVFWGTWRDSRRKRHRKSVDNHGNEHFKLLKESEGDESKGDIVHKDIEVWRECTVLGGVVIREWGETENQPRSIDDIAVTTPKITAFIPNYLNYTTTSLVGQAKGLQKFKDIIMYNVQLAMNRAGGKGFVYDVSQIPEGWEVEHVMHYLKQAGIAFINSAEQGYQGQNIQTFQEFDMTLSQSINQYLAIAQELDRQMDMVTGVNDQRQGFIKNSSQAVGVTQSAITQSALSTKYYSEGFKMFQERVFTKLAGICKIAALNTEKWAPIIGDYNAEWLQYDDQIAINNYATFIEFVPAPLKEKNQLNDFIQLALQNRSIDIEDAIKLLRENDVDAGIKKLEESIERKKKEMERQRMKQMQYQQKLQQQEKQSEIAQEKAEERISEQLKQWRQQNIENQRSENEKEEIMLKESLNDNEESYDIDY